MEQRRQRDVLKGSDPLEWERQYAAAKARALAQLAAAWEGDARPFAERAEEEDDDWDEA
jgi:hypothetical protein